MTRSSNENSQDAILNNSDSPNTTPAKRRWSYNRAMKWIRWTHLYLGLFMFPWILLYGITGFLLNHPSAFPDHEIRKLDPQILEDTALDELPAPDEIARRVFDSLAKMENTSLEGYRIMNPERARYRYEAIFNTNRSGKQYQLVLHLNERSGKLHIRSAQPQRETPLGRVHLLDDSVRQQLRAGVIEVLERLDVSTQNVNMQWGPLTEFEITDGDRTWIINYNLGNRNVAARPKEGWPGINSVRQYLLRLHFAHTFPAGIGLRTFWAIMVDAMSAGMVLWALTGFLLWWQRRNTRLTGMIVTGISILWACGVGYIMYQMFRQ